jgi:arabinogalactan oligomer/maltooligosaccharide transport system substrate-binding protein
LKLGKTAIAAIALVIAAIGILAAYFLTLPPPSQPTPPAAPPQPQPTQPTQPAQPQQPTQPQPPGPTLQTLTIGASSIRVPADFYDFVEKVRRGEVKVTINFWTQMSDWEVSVMKSVIERFQKEYPGVTVKYTNVQNMKEQVKAGVLTGDVENTAHVFTWAHDWTGDLADSGAIIALDRYLPPETIVDLKGQYMALAFTSGMYKLRLYGLPWAAEAIALVCNEDFVPAAPRSWGEYEKVVQEWHNPSKNTYGLAYQIDPYHVYPFVTAFGGFYYDEDKNAVGVNSPGTVEGLTFYVTHVMKYMYAADTEMEAQLKIFLEKRAPCMITGPWNTKTIQENIRNAVVYAIPPIDGKTPKPFSGIKLLWITSVTTGDKNRLYASLLFSMWFTLSDDGLRILVDAGYIPVKLLMLQYLQANADKYPMILGFAQSVANSVPMPKSANMNYVWGPVADALRAIVTKYNEQGADAAVKAIKQLLDEAQSKIEAKIKS